MAELWAREAHDSQGTGACPCDWALLGWTLKCTVLATLQEACGASESPSCRIQALGIRSGHTAALAGGLSKPHNSLERVTSSEGCGGFSSLVSDLDYSHTIEAT